MQFSMSRLTKSKLIFLLFIIFVISFLFGIYSDALNQVHESHFNTENYESLNEGILHFYNRNSWLDDLLCKDKYKSPIHSSIADIIPLKILYREIWPSKITSQKIFLFEDNCQTTIPYFVQCALESAAFRNPSATIYLITVAPFLEDGSKTIQNLLNRFPNIIIIQADFDSVLKGTPLDSFRSPVRWTDNPDIFRSHVNDALKLALLWKEGGAYLDTDLISFKQIPSGDNVILLERDIFHGFFMKASKHHDYLQEIMKIQNSTYDGTWYSMGSLSIAEGIAQYCNETIKKAGKCKDLSILPYNEFSAVAGDKLEELFKSPHEAHLSKLMENAYGVHTNHLMMGDRLNEIGDSNVYADLGRSFCPYSFNQKELKG